jgi:tetratricopeptide (TPR) repeat protein
MGWQATILAVLLQAIHLVPTAPVASQANGPYLVTGIFIAPHVGTGSDFEISLADDAGMIVDQLRSQPNERFAFSRLPAGTYYLVVDTPGFKPMRQRVDVRGLDRDISASLVLEEQDQTVVVPRTNFSGERDATISVAEMAQPASVLKDLADAARKLQAGNIDAARGRLESIVIEAPGFYEAHKSLGMAYQLSGRYHDAEKEFRIARDLRPNSAAPLISLASLYLEQLEAGSAKAATLLDDARDALQSALLVNPEAAFGHYLLGVANHKAALYSDAKKNLVRALELEPKLGSARLALANVHMRLQDWPAALLQLDTYLKENPQAADREQIRAKRAQVEEVSLKATASSLAR